MLKSKKNWLDKFNNLFANKSHNKDELIAIAQKFANDKIIEKTSMGMIEGVLTVQDLKVKDISIPKSQMVTISEKLNFLETIATITRSGHSRFPVIGNNKEEILGILLAKDLLTYDLSQDNSDFKVKDLLRTALFVPESKKLTVLLQEFRHHKNHLAVVINEYGGVTGLVTIEDVIEQIVGNIEDEYDVKDEPSIKQINKHQYNVKAATEISEFNKYFGCEFISKEINTIGGLLTKQLGKIPKTGESIIIQKFKFKILKSTQRKALLVQVTLQE